MLKAELISLQKAWYDLSVGAQGLPPSPAPGHPLGCTQSSSTVLPCPFADELWETSACGRCDNLDKYNSKLRLR